jgi:pyruvate dehydrogenase E1 component
VPYVTSALSGSQGPLVAVSDWMRSVPDQLSRWIPGDYSSLGTDGFGRSDTRGALRRYFHVDAESTVVAVLSRLVASGEVKQETLQQAVDSYKLTEVSAASAGNTGGDS